MHFLHFLLMLACAFVLSACSPPSITDTSAPQDKEDSRKLGFGGLGGDDLLTFGPGTKKKSEDFSSPVNSYLWQSSLSVLDFMPLVSADAAGGVLVTDWYTGSEKPNEKVKVTVVITGKVLRADALKVMIYKQIKAKNGAWINAKANPEIVTELENIILTKARQLRVRALSR